ncbi:uncharacterized protein MONBRDRAFT_29943 [Monosiga brevicollis MX1]|uniref:Sec20 C-terminal domain-containing protein n=1 Tax=Monosiga brevicollis TaxID=81824 RepID=A9VCK4_MONBE|nr:uncharacterized protein MONBRDRAFT_29943 [Monosiga brevicollis MX1]EDQ84764.1 predicted protein [Monosiga brevicollis MX1]|eukprot:XP_001750414.1 hypothetical protein [Monosiga brevicollis MX1]
MVVLVLVLVIEALSDLVGDRLQVYAYETEHQLRSDETVAHNLLQRFERAVETRSTAEDDDELQRYTQADVNSVRQRLEEALRDALRALARRQRQRARERLLAPTGSAAAATATPEYAFGLACQPHEPLQSRRVLLPPPSRNLLIHHHGLRVHPPRRDGEAMLRSKLARAQAMMGAHLEADQATHEHVAVANEALASINATLGIVVGSTKSSAKLSHQLQHEHRKNQLYIFAGFSIFLLTIMYILFKRLSFVALLGALAIALLLLVYVYIYLLCFRARR